jgi:hypothetical protein
MAAAAAAAAALKRAGFGPAKKGGGVGAGIAW